MGIENWGDFEEQRTEEIPAAQEVDEPRRHSLGGFQPGRGFGPSEAESYEMPESLDFEETADMPPFPDSAPATSWKS